MHWMNFLLFLTLVQTNLTVSAAPHNDVSPIESQIENAEEKMPTKSLADENLSPTEPVDTHPESKTDYYYPYMQSISPRIAIVLDTNEATSDLGSATEYAYGFHYLFPRYQSPQFEVGADLITNSIGHLNAAKRWIINERSGFRPFYKVGLTMKVIGREGLATFASIDNYLVRAAVGFEDYLKAPMSLRLELELAAGLEDTLLIFSFGYSWGF